MNQVASRLKKLEAQCLLRNGRSLDVLTRRAQEMVKHTGLKFEDAASEIVGELTAQDLERVIAEARSKYGKEIVGHEPVQQ